jgi:hypothetical protein
VSISEIFYQEEMELQGEIYIVLHQESGTFSFAIYLKWVKLVLPISIVIPPMLQALFSSWNQAEHELALFYLVQNFFKDLINSTLTTCLYVGELQNSPFSFSSTNYTGL